MTDTPVLMLAWLWNLTREPYIRLVMWPLPYNKRRQVPCGNCTVPRSDASPAVLT